MDFLTTLYIYPLSEKIPLSRHFNFSLDNPRTPDEILTLKRYLLREFEAKPDDTIPVDTFEQILFEFRDAFSASDPYVASFFEQYKREEIIEFIAKMWVIARYEGEDETPQIDDKALRKLKTGKVAALWLEDEHQTINNSNRLVNYSYLLSLLMHTEGENYFGRCFLLDPNEDSYSFQPRKNVWIDFYMFASAVRDGVDRLDELRWTYLTRNPEDLLRATTILDEAFDEGLIEKLLYIGGILKIVSNDVRDVKVSLVMLTSIIELLLTHNPDANRFNVEDSISKQYQLKASILIYLNDKKQDIYQIKKRLKAIYEQRSNVAHGNFGAIHKYVSKLSKKEGEEEYFEDLKVDLYRYIRAILEEYFKDRAFVDFLKES
jgi:Apea-like HEPN